MTSPIHPSLVDTPQGAVVLRPPTRDLLRAIRDLLPLGLVGIEPPRDRAAFGLVMQCGERELLAVKQQPPECRRAEVPVVYEANLLLVTGTFHRYLRRGFGGLLLPCPYLRDKGSAGVEAGIAYFIYPSPAGRETTETGGCPAYDQAFGRGASAMLGGFIEDLQATSRETGLALFPTIGLEPRPRRQLGSIGFSFLLVGSELVCLKTRISGEDPIWTVLRSTGIDRVWHLPSLPYGIGDEDLAISKPEAAGSN